jgi:hypothetical protein
VSETEIINSTKLKVNIVKEMVASKFCAGEGQQGGNQIKVGSLFQSNHIFKLFQPLVNFMSTSKIESEIIGNTFVYTAVKKSKTPESSQTGQQISGNATFKFEKDQFSFEANLEKKDQNNSVPLKGSGLSNSQHFSNTQEL